MTPTTTDFGLNALTAKVNLLWANYLQIPDVHIDRLYIGELKSGETFLGFEAGDATPFMITRSVQSDVQYIYCGGQKIKGFRWTLNGLALDSTLQDNDWEPFESKDGTAFPVSTNDFLQLAELIADCANESLPLLDFTN